MKMDRVPAFPSLLRSTGSCSWLARLGLCCHPQDPSDVLLPSELWLRRTWEGRCPPNFPAQPPPLWDKSTCLVSFSSHLILPHDTKPNLKRLFSAHMKFLVLASVRENTLHTASEQLSCYRDCAGTEQSICVGTTSYGCP